ncbi:MAG TPA: FtsQ-type POTRA domain-containing protein [Desulfobacteria bacterium]|nr:FtsQ-type POTRA domain-containing protein [Desulfobacteria bacterium]
MFTLARRSNNRVWIISITLLAALAVLGALRSPMFNVQQVVVEGNRLVSEQDILDLANVGLGTNIFRVPTASIAQNVALHPLIKSVNVSRRLPSTLVISVTERQPVAMVPVQNGFVIVDEQGVFLQRSDTWPKNAVPIISGVKIPNNLDLGKQIQGASLQEGLKIVAGLPKQLYAQVGEVYAGNQDMLAMYTRDGLEVRLGLAEDLNQKFSVLRQFLDDKDYQAYRTGFYVDLSSGKPVIGKK